MEGSLANGQQRPRSRTLQNWTRRAFQYLQSLRQPDRALPVLRSLAVLAGVALVFYQSLLAVVFLLPLIAPLTRRFERRRMERRREQLMAEFRELLGSVLTALKAGYAPENAFREAYQEMVFLFGEEGLICQELLRILHGLDNHIPLEDLLYGFAARSGVDEITEFADVFAIAKRRGGNLTEILERTDGLIRDRIDVENEIRLLLASRRYEQTVMDLVPFGIIIYIGTTSPGFFDAMYHNAFGILVMSGCLAAYLAAFRLSERILDIHV